MKNFKIDSNNVFCFTLFPNEKNKRNSSSLEVQGKIIDWVHDYLTIKPASPFSR